MFAVTDHKTKQMTTLFTMCLKKVPLFNWLCCMSTDFYNFWSSTQWKFLLLVCMSLVFCLSNFSIILWHQNYISADVTAVL